MQLRANQAALFTRLSQVREGTLRRTEEVPVASGEWPDRARCGRGWRCAHGPSKTFRLSCVTLSWKAKYNESSFLKTVQRLQPQN